MPTGYTARLKEMNYDVKRWLKESVVRGIGVTMSLRDEGTLSEKEIAKRLKEQTDEGSYNAKALKLAQTKLRDARTWDENQWQNSFEAELAKAQRDYKRRLKEHNEGKEAHIAAIAEIERIAKRKGQDEVTAGTLKFALEQLQSAFDFDYGHEPYREKVLDQNVATFKEETLKSLEWDVQYHTEQSRKKCIANTDCHASYLKFTKFIDAACVSPKIGEKDG